MTIIDPDTTVRRSIVVRAQRDRAFQVFTEGIGSWWPPGPHRIGPEPAELIFDPRGVAGAPRTCGPCRGIDRPRDCGDGDVRPGPRCDARRLVLARRAVTAGGFRPPRAHAHAHGPG